MSVYVGIDVHRKRSQVAVTWLAELDLPPASREIVPDCLAVIDALAPVIERIDGELRQHAKAGPRVKVLTTLPGLASRRVSAQTRAVTADTRPPGMTPLRKGGGRFQQSLSVIALV